jgi:hypothetical protein
MIKQRVIKSRYKLTQFATLELDDVEQNELLSKITSGQEHDGSTFLKIYTDDKETIETFRPED